MFSLNHNKLKAENRELRRELEALRSHKIPKALKGLTETIFTDKEGRKYYRFKNPTDMPALRGFKSQELMRWAEMNLTREVQKKYYETIRELFNKGDLTKGFQTFENMCERAEVKTDEAILWEIAAVHYLRSDEDYRTYNEAFASEKIAYWKGDPEISAFFLARSFKEIWNCGKLSEEAIQSSLKEARKELKRLAPEKLAPQTPGTE